MKGAFGKFVGVARWVVRLGEEVDRGIAVGRGARAARGRVRAHGAGRRGAGG